MLIDILWKIAPYLLMGCSAVISGVFLSGVRRHTFHDTEAGLLFLRILLCIGLIGDIFGLFFQLFQCLLRIPYPNPLNEGIVLGVFFVFLIVVTLIIVLKAVSIFPKDNGLLLIADKSQQKRLTHCIVGMIITSVFYISWILFVIMVESTEPMEKQMAFLGFSFIVLVGLIYYDKLSIRSVYERLEIIVDQQYQAELMNLMQVIRSQRHDFNFHMQAISGMISNEKYQECQEYIATMVKKAVYLNDVLPLQNPATSAMINAFVDMAASKDIRLEVQILTPLDDLPCTVYEINTVIGNLLQNAIDETENKSVNDKWIRLLIMKRNRRDIIKVTNPCEKKPEEFEEIFHPGYTTKMTHEGIGLVTVKKITGTYGGAIYLEHDPGVVHFIARIPSKS